MYTPLMHCDTASLHDASLIYYFEGPQISRRQNRAEVIFYCSIIHRSAASSVLVYIYILYKDAHDRAKRAPCGGGSSSSGGTWMRNGGTGVCRKQREARMRVVRAPPGAPPASPQHQAPPGGLLHTEAVDIHTCALPTIAYTKIVAASAAGKGSQRTSLSFVYKGERGTRSLSPCKGWAVRNGHCKQLYKKRRVSHHPQRGCRVGQVPFLAFSYFFFSLCTLDFLSRATHRNARRKRDHDTAIHAHTHTLHIQPMKSHLLAHFSR